MRNLVLSAALLCLVTSPLAAQSATCRTDNASCEGYTMFGPSAIDRCLSIRGQTRTDFCEKQGDTQRVQIHSGDRYCAVAGATAPPEQCDLHWIVVTEPQ